MAAEVSEYGISIIRDKIHIYNKIYDKNGLVDSYALNRFPNSFRSLGEYNYTECVYKIDNISDEWIIIRTFADDIKIKKPCSHECFIDYADSCGYISVAIACNNCHKVYWIDPFGIISEYDVSTYHINCIVNTGDLVVISTRDEQVLCIYKNEVKKTNISRFKGHFFYTSDEAYKDKAIVFYYTTAIKKNTYIVPIQPEYLDFNTKPAPRTQDC
jgi:hypothetical protein